MDKIKLWAIDSSSTGDSEVVRPASELTNTETEAQLEDLLVRNPSLLMPGLKLIGRQVPTNGGPLDLVGVDGEGQLVIFELKRGQLTRDAVAQIIDYASDFSARDSEDLVRLVEKYSGQKGIEEISDFGDWLSQEFPDSGDIFEETPRMVLVGLGADERAVRMVNFLADSGIDIQLLTFQAFDVEGKTFLARTSSTTDLQERKNVAAENSKAGNQKALNALASENNVLELINQVAKFVSDRMPASYMWPGKTAYSLSLPEKTSEGKPSLRSYVAIWIPKKEIGKIVLSFPQRALDLVEQEISDLVTSSPYAKSTSSQWTPFELEVTSGNWSELQEPLDLILNRIVKLWKNKVDSES